MFSDWVDQILRLKRMDPLFYGLEAHEKLSGSHVVVTQFGHCVGLDSSWILKTYDACRVNYDVFRCIKCVTDSFMVCSGTFKKFYGVFIATALGCTMMRLGASKVHDSQFIQRWQGKSWCVQEHHSWMSVNWSCSRWYQCYSVLYRLFVVKGKFRHDGLFGFYSLQPAQSEVPVKHTPPSQTSLNGK